ncbi:MAG: hypothetical protein V4718_03000, partial [Pseudomonadota bacterium]
MNPFSTQLKKASRVFFWASLVLALASPLAYAKKEKRTKTERAAASESRKAARAERKTKQAQTQAARTPVVPKAVVRDGEAEARLIDIYKLIGQAKTREALGKAEVLVRDAPTFQLAQLVYGDLLA